MGSPLGMWRLGIEAAMTAGVSVDLGDWGNPGRRGGRSKNNFNYVPTWCSLWKKNILNRMFFFTIYQ